MSSGIGSTSTSPELSYWLAKVDEFFGINHILDQSIDNEYVVDYYRKSDIGYRIVHSDKGAVHMALNYDGQFDEDGYYEQARIVEKHIRGSGITKVLELACGKGFNSIYLAGRNQDIMFTGIDLFSNYIKQAEKCSRDLANINFQQGDFQDLPFPNSSFDLVFEVEGVCHATNMPAALTEISRVLKPGGHFILFDGFRQPGFPQAHKDLQLAARLVETAMAIKEGYVISDWLEIAERAGLTVLSVDDFSDAILPNLLRFQRIAKKYLRHGFLRRVFLKFLSRILLMNAVAGLLMPFTLKEKVQGYFCIELAYRGKK